MAFTDIGDAVVGAVAPASWGDAVRENFLLAGPHLIVRKPSDESVVSSTTFQADDHLILPVAANEVYKFEFDIYATGPAAAGIKFQVTFPTAGAVGMNVGYIISGVETIFNTVFTTSPANTITPDMGTGGMYLTIPSIYIGGANAGNVTLEWAQNTSNATPTIVKANSTLWAVKLA